MCTRSAAAVPEYAPVAAEAAGAFTMKAPELSATAAAAVRRAAGL
jgi:hypothetical protein